MVRFTGEGPNRRHLVTGAFWIPTVDYAGARDLFPIQTALQAAGLLICSDVSVF